MGDKAWAQFLFVAVPVLSLVGAWLALRAVSGRRKPQDKAEDQ
ncbi:hypothetical protein [Azoarcus sp. DD4]|nr:hypothetical protein [Azoarcus sp. DD4]